MARDTENLKKWAKDSLINFSIKLNRENDKDIIEHLKTIQNKRQYMLELIRQDINKGTN